MEKRNGLIIDGVVSQATGTAERDCAEQLSGHIKASKPHRITLGSDKNYDTHAHTNMLSQR